MNLRNGLLIILSFGFVCLFTFLLLSVDISQQTAPTSISLQPQAKQVITPAS